MVPTIPDFKVGAQVRLNADGRLMRITAVGQGEQAESYECQWLDRHGHLQTKWLPGIALSDAEFIIPSFTV